MKKFTRGSIFKTLGLILVAALPTACSFFGFSDQQSRLARTDTVLSLVGTNDATSYSRASAAGPRGQGASARAAIPPPGNTTIHLRAEVSPPSASDGTSLQASHIALDPSGKYAFVSYMLEGEVKYGGLDVFEVSMPASPRLAASSLFPDADIAAVAYSQKTVFLAGSKDDPQGAGNNAWVVAIPFQGNRLAINAYQQVFLPGYFATDIAAQGTNLYVTTGTGGGVYKLDAISLAIMASDSSGLDDLRSVYADGSQVIVLCGQWPNDSTTVHPKLRFYDSSLTTSSPDLSLDNFNLQPGAKSRMEVIGDKLYVASNLKGVAVLDLGAKSEVASIPAPSLAGIAAKLQSSNAVSSGFANSTTIYFIANGEAGLWVGDSESVIDATSSPGHGVAGSIRFGSGQSVNYVAGKNSLVVAAVGTGGLKIMELQ